MTWIANLQSASFRNETVFVCVSPSFTQSVLPEAPVTSSSTLFLSKLCSTTVMVAVRPAGKYLPLTALLLSKRTLTVGLVWSMVKSALPSSCTV